MMLLTRLGCPFCREFSRIIQRYINYKLPPWKKIEIKDCRFYEQYNIDIIPVMKKLEKDGLNEGFPFCFLILDEENLQGVVVEPAPSIVLKTYLDSLLKEEYLSFVN